TVCPLPRDWGQEPPALSRPHLPGRLLGQLTDPGRPRTSASPHPDPALTLGWSVHQPGEVSGLQPPAPVLRGGSRIAAVSSPRRAHTTTSRRPRHAPHAYIINPKNLSPVFFSPYGDRGQTPRLDVCGSNNARRRGV